MAGPPTQETKVDLLFIFQGAKYSQRWRLLCMTRILWAAQMLEQSVKAAYCWVTKRVKGASKARDTHSWRCRHTGRTSINLSCLRMCVWLSSICLFFYFVNPLISYLNPIDRKKKNTSWNQIKHLWTNTKLTPNQLACLRIQLTKELWKFSKNFLACRMMASNSESKCIETTRTKLSTTFLQ